jgi:hypothetical protein
VVVLPTLQRAIEVRTEMLDIQIPVAVIETEPDDQNGLGEIRGKLKEELGESHVLEEILSLNDLGMDVPQNSNWKGSEKRTS